MILDHLVTVRNMETQLFALANHLRGNKCHFIAGLLTHHHGSTGHMTQQGQQEVSVLGQELPLDEWILQKSTRQVVAGHFAEVRH